MFRELFLLFLFFFFFFCLSLYVTMDGLVLANIGQMRVFSACPWFFVLGIYFIYFFLSFSCMYMLVLRGLNFTKMMPMNYSSSHMATMRVFAIKCNSY